jgi:hypothetical protein
VPLAPRLQIALHLSLTLNEQHYAFFQAAAGPGEAAPVMPAATAAATVRKASTARRFPFAAQMTRVETAYRTPAGARGFSPLSFGPAKARGIAAHAGRLVSLVYAAPGFRQVALPGGSFPGHGYDGPSRDAGVPPPWPLRQEAGAAGPAYIARDRPGRDRLLVTRLGNRPAVVRAGAHGSSDPVADRTILAAWWPGAGRPVGKAAFGSRNTRLRERLIKSRGGASGPVAEVRTRSRPSRADRHGERPPPARADRPGVTNRIALRSSAAGPAGHRLQRPGQPAAHLIPRRLPGGMAFAVDRLSAASGRPAAPVAAAPLYFAERPVGRAAATASFGSAWTPPPLDYRSAAPPPAPPPHAEARPAPTAIPSPAALDLEAVSRNVIGRIEKRLRIERERRGRS